MSPERSSDAADPEVERVVATDDALVGHTSKVPGLRLASAVMFVRELDRSVVFYEELLGWHVTVSNESAALLVGPEGFQLYLRAVGSHASHPLGFVGIQYLSWTASDEADLRRCENVLRRESSRVSTTSGDGFTLIEGHGPDGVPVMVTYPGADQVPRQEILRRIYEW